MSTITILSGLADMLEQRASERLDPSGDMQFIANAIRGQIFWEMEDQD